MNFKLSSVNNVKSSRFINIVILSLLLLVPFTAKAQTGNQIDKRIVSQDDKENQKIKSLKVKSRKLYSAYYVKGRVPDKKSIVMEDIYYRNGKISRHMEYNYYGAAESTTKYTYDKKGNLVKTETLDLNGNVSNQQFSKFDNKGNEIEKHLVVYKRGKHENSIKYKYDDQHNIIQAKVYGEKNHLQEIHNFIYKNGIQTGTKITDGNGNLLIESLLEYDDNGHLTKETKKGNGANYVFSYEYDGNGNLIKMTDTETKRYYAYNENNDVKEFKMFLLDGRRQARIEYIYGENGLKKHEIRYDNLEKPVFYSEYRYEYYN